MTPDWSPSTQSNRRLSRRRTLQVGVAATLAAVIGPLAGCSDVASDDGSNPISERLAAVPAKPGAVRWPPEEHDDAPTGQDAVGYADVAAVREDPVVETARQSLDPEAAPRAGRTLVGTILGLGRLQAPPHDVGSVEEMVAFGNTAHVAIEPTAIFWADWDPSALLASLSDRYSFEGYREEEYKGRTVHVPEGKHEYVPGVGVLDDGRFVLGDRRAVETVVTVDDGEIDSLSGTLHDDLVERTTGPVRATARLDGHYLGIDPAFWEPVDRLVASFLVSEGTRGAELRIVGTDPEAAGEIQDALAPVVEGGSDDPVLETLDDSNLERDGTTVTVRYEDDIDEVQRLVRESL